MLSSIATIIVASAAAVSACAVPKRSQSASITPHEQYSSSVGVLGCKINTNRVAYWPGSVDCNNICVKVSYQGRSLNLLKIDSSTGAHDISYDAWNYLAFGKSAKEEPHAGAGINMEYEYVHADECKDLLHDGKLAVAAGVSMNFYAGCRAQENSWVAKNIVLVNMVEQLCKYGWDETCTVDMSVSNQPQCPHPLMDQKPTGIEVKNIQYGTGKEVVAA